MVLIGIDLGQGALKAAALAHDGRVLGLESEPYTTYHPWSGWSEQDPRDWIEAMGRACRRLMAGLGPPSRVAVEGIGLSSATHHAVLLDAWDRPLRRCIMLTDGRSAGQVRRLTTAHQPSPRTGDLLLARARNVAAPCWTLPQLLWIAEEEPDVWARTARLALAKDYLRLALTGVWATDWIDAEGTLLWDATTRRWDPDLCGLISLPLAWLPPALAPTSVTGAVTPAGESLTGLPAGTPVMAGCSDTAAEAFAAGACADGQGVVKLATAGNVNVMTRRPRPRPEWFTYSHPVPGLSYHTLGTNAAAASERWFRGIVGGTVGIGYAELEREAAAAPPGCAGLLFHPYLLGERAPCWNPDLRASFVGLDAAHGRGHLARAVLEGVAFSLADCLDVLRSHDLMPSAAQVIGGGARSPLWRAIVCDALGLPLHYPSLSDASAGAALLAGVGVGVYSSHEDAVERTVRVVATHTPDPGRHRGYTQMLEVYRDIRQRLAPLHRRLLTIEFT